MYHIPLYHPVFTSVYCSLPPYERNKQRGNLVIWLAHTIKNQPTNQPRSLNLSKISSSLRITFVSVVHYLQLRSFLLSTHPYIVLVMRLGLMPPKYETLIVLFCSNISYRDKTICSNTLTLGVNQSPVNVVAHVAHYGNVWLNTFHYIDP
jgi:hypothetical protein